MRKIITSLNEYCKACESGANPAEQFDIDEPNLDKFNDSEESEESEEFEELGIDTKILDELVELVGSEEDVEAAANAAHQDLMDAFEKNEVEIDEEDLPENLALASLVLKLVDMGKIETSDAEEFLQKHID